MVLFKIGAFFVKEEDFKKKKNEFRKNLRKISMPKILLFPFYFYFEALFDLCGLKTRTSLDEKN